GEIFFLQAEDGIRDRNVTGVQTCALPISEEMDDNLAKLRVSAGAGEQRMLLTEILVDSELMESALEKIPVDSATSTDISSFVNRSEERRVGKECRWQRRTSHYKEQRQKTG